MTKYETALTIEKKTLCDTPEWLSRALETYTDDLLRELDMKGTTTVKMEEATLNVENDAYAYNIELEVK